MKLIDKNLLLAELFCCDCSSYLGSYVERISKSDEYFKLSSNVKEMVYDGTNYAKEIIKQYNNIDFNKIKTIEEAIYCYVTILDLLYKTNVILRINPLIPKFQNVINPGTLLINFDGDSKPLQEVVIGLKDYSLVYKSNKIRETVDSWRKDGYTYIESNIAISEYVLNKELYKKVLGKKIVKMIFTILAVLFGLSLFICPSTYFKSLFSNQSDILDWISIIPLLLIPFLVLSYIASTYRENLYLDYCFTIKSNNKTMPRLIRKEYANRAIQLNKILQKSLKTGKLEEEKIKNCCKEYTNIYSLDSYKKSLDNITKRTNKFLNGIFYVLAFLFIISVISLLGVYVLRKIGVIK